MRLSFAYSPCPNDTFMFEPIVNSRIDTMGIDFDIVLAEVEELNQAAFESKYDISKLSFNAFTKLTDTYRLLNSGSALGRGCGPILVSKPGFSLADIDQATVAIPGINTTANLLLDIAVPTIGNKEVIVFHDIEEAVSNGLVDAGLLIHESRFTFMDHGLVKLMDMGDYWEKTTQMPIPLGGIAISNNIDRETQKKVNQVLYNSISYAQENPRSGLDYIRCHAQEMDTDVMYKHIDLYVNSYSQDLGDEGKESVLHLFTELHRQGKIDHIPDDIFVI